MTGRARLLKTNCMRRLDKPQLLHTLDGSDVSSELGDLILIVRDFLLDFVDLGLERVFALLETPLGAGRCGNGSLGWRLSSLAWRPTLLAKNLFGGVDPRNRLVIATNFQSFRK